MKVRKLNPGATVGVLGGGQLGRYFALIARQRGYAVWVLDPDEQAPAMQVASVALVAAYDDEPALEQMGKACDAITIEFENVPARSLEILAGLTQLAPAAASVQISQNRLDEKQQAAQCGLMPVPHVALQTAEQVSTALEQVQLPAILKTARLGYDGKGQTSCHSAEDVLQALKQFGNVTCVLEQRIDLAAEISVVLARSFDGEMAVFPVAGNVHVDGILFSSTVPTDVSEALQNDAVAQARALAAAIDHVGVLAVEFFIDTQNRLYFNEMAPRPHNSGHYTLDATLCSQFEQQLRVLCAQPLGSTQLLSPVAMFNLLGDLWPADAQPDFSALMATPGCQLHLYGKSQARPGRKMGHVNCLDNTSTGALETANRLFENLKQ